MDVTLNRQAGRVGEQKINPSDFANVSQARIIPLITVNGFSYIADVRDPILDRAQPADSLLAATGKEASSPGFDFSQDGGLGACVASGG